ncbi:phage head-tail joining protein [Crenalkalicoccus roseus]|uniref:phage head-tail joining protein n=1 Tax=Crenalkalicoccus roseus TaxID=1485588 RepID=UPI0010818F59|nr:hypothetical protein [Crenalkalicoccus roseus]
MSELERLQAQREALRAQRASGVARVTVDGRTVEYRSGADIERALSAIEAQIARVERRARRRVVYIAGDKSL